MNRMLAALLAAAMVSAVATLPAPAETFPDHVVKIVVPYPPGGPGDTTTRLTTRNFADKLGQTVIIENEPGAGGKMAAKVTSRATPDGYTLFSGGTNENAIVPALYKNLDYDPVKSFVPVAALATDSNAVVVNPSLPVATLAELGAYAKEHPGKLTSGSTIGISPHLLLEFLRARMQTDIVYVPYKGAAPTIADLLGNQIQLSSSAKSVLLPLIKAGKLRALAVSSSERWPELPDVPTLHEAGFDGFPPALWFVMMAPAGTPADRINKLNEAINAGLRTEESQTGIAKLGLQPRVLSTAEIGAVMAKEVPLWEAVAREAGVRLD
jgi:tripartite-type tricarboxylate transporter receptor subunit TctC